MDLQRSTVSLISSFDAHLSISSNNYDKRTRRKFKRRLEKTRKKRARENRRKRYKRKEVLIEEFNRYILISVTIYAHTVRRSGFNSTQPISPKGKINTRGVIIAGAKPDEIVGSSERSELDGGDGAIEIEREW